MSGTAGTTGTSGVVGREAGAGRGAAETGGVATVAGACAGTTFIAGSDFVCGAGWKTAVPPGLSFPATAVRDAAAGLVPRGVAVPGVGKVADRGKGFVTVPSRCRRKVFPHFPHRIESPLGPTRASSTR